MEYAGTANARSAPETISGDTFTGQLSHLDSMISDARSHLDRVTKIANVLSPSEPPTEKPGAVIAGRIDNNPDAGPLIFRLQNRNQELNRLLHQTAMQICRIEQVL